MAYSDQLQPELDLEAQLDRQGEIHRSLRDSAGVVEYWEQGEEDEEEDDEDVEDEDEDEDDDEAKEEDDELDDSEDRDPADLEGGLRGGADRNGIYNDADVNESVFEALEMQPDFVEEVTRMWNQFLNSGDSREAIGEAVYSALFESAPALQSLFKTPRAVLAMRFMNGINQIICSLGNPAALKVLVETLGFQHLEMEVTAPRVVVFRDAVLDLIVAELGESVTQMALSGLSTVLNYCGGAFIYVRVKFTDRLKVLASSWATANKSHDWVDSSESAGGSAEERRLSGEQGAKQLAKGGKHGSAANMDESGCTFANTCVPTSYKEMFAFNAAVMGFSTSVWMNEVLESFDAIVQNVSNSYRLQEECDVLSLRMAKYRMKIDLGEYRTVMLASLRSLVPKTWNSEHEVAWHWLWDNVERMLKAQMGKPCQHEKCLERLWGSLDDEGRAFLRRESYSKFFAVTPAGQDYFKQSTTRLHFIADKAMAMTLEIFKDPVKMVTDISALGLRHVGYGIPTELFSPFVTSCAQTVRELTDDDEAVEAFRWSLSLISRILTRVVTEGSTIVMKAINQNSSKRLRKAVQCAPRGKRALWMLNIQVGAQSISPFMWAVETGRLDAARAIVVDLLTIRADRDRYYYGVDTLFERHPDVIKRLCVDAPALLRVLLDGLVWRSRTTERGMRRVNYYVQHLLVSSDGHFDKALEWITDTSDPKIVCHPVVAVVMDTVWSRIGFRAFLLGKVWFILTLVVFLLGTAGTKHLAADSQADRVIVFACRCFTYVFILGRLLWYHARRSFLDIRSKALAQLWGLPVPAYLVDLQEAAGFLLTACLVVMLWLEPVLHCIPHSHGDFPGSGSLTPACPQAEDSHFAYSAVSVVAVFLYFALAVDMTVFSTRISALVFACYRIAAEFGMFLLGLCIAIVAFGSAACALDQGNEDFSGVRVAALSLTRISFGMYRGERFEALQNDPGLMMIVVLYIVVTLVFLFNLLIAQFNCSYLSTYEDMLGYARLRRGRVVVEAMAEVSEKSWKRFVESLRLDERCEFGEGDVGLPGAIQTIEPANLHPTDREMIRRFGGSTSPAAQWPEEGDASEDEEDRFARLEKMVNKAMKRSSGGRGAGSVGLRSSTGSSGLNHSSGSTLSSASDRSE